MGLAKELTKRAFKALEKRNKKAAAKKSKETTEKAAIKAEKAAKAKQLKGAKTYIDKDGIKVTKYPDREGVVEKPQSYVGDVGKKSAKKPSIRDYDNSGMNYKKGGTVKKCRMDGIALRGKTRAKERSK